LVLPSGSDKVPGRGDQRRENAYYMNDGEMPMMGARARAARVEDL
jgi:hypothetical protein